jgi:hypothetical protein
VRSETPNIRLKKEVKRKRTRAELDEIARERRVKYWDRKLRQVCTNCEAQLGPNDTQLCESCRGNQALNQERYRGTRGGRSAMLKASKRHYKHRRKDARKRDLCVRCLMPRKEWPPARRRVAGSAST